MKNYKITLKFAGKQPEIIILAADNSDRKGISKALLMAGLNPNGLYKSEELPPIEWTRINNDTNGNPRYVCHFLNLIKDSDEFTSIDKRYNLAISRAKKIGGRKYHTKSYGGGIVFQSYNIQETERSIYELLETL